MRRKIDNIEEKHTALENKIEIKELTKAFIKDESWADVVKKEVTINLDNMKDDIREIEKTVVETKTCVEEAREKESRRKKRNYL